MRWPVVPMALFLIFLGSISAAWAQVQSHPLSQISPIDSNLNMYTYNSSVGYLNYSYGILSNGTQGILTADIASSAVTGSRIASSAITSSKISNPLGGPMNATAYYDSDNSNYFLDPASSGTSLATAGSVGIGTTTPARTLSVSGSNSNIGIGGFHLAILTNTNTTDGTVVGLGFATNTTGAGATSDQILASVETFFTTHNHATRTGELAFGTTNSGSFGERMRITGTGNVGIGTASPGTALDVSKTSADAIIRAETTTSGSSILDLLNNGNQQYQIVANRTSNRLEITRSGVGTAIAVDPNTLNVGIGTTSPQSNLHVYQDADVWHTRIGGASGELRMGGQTSNGSVIQAYTPGGVARDLYLQRDGGKVGIGTAQPNGKLDVIGSSGVPDFGTGLTGIMRVGGPTIEHIEFGYVSGSRDWIQGFGAVPLYINEGGNNVILNSLGGSVGIGKVSPTNKLDVNGTVGVNNGANVVYRCTTAGTLPVGALTVNTSSCGATADTGLRVS